MEHGECPRIGKMLRADGLTKKFGGLIAIDGASFEVKTAHPNRHSGARIDGKSTLFNVISGLFPPSAGRLVFCDEDITHLPLI